MSSERNAPTCSIKTARRGKGRQNDGESFDFNMVIHISTMWFMHMYHVRRTTDYKRDSSPTAPVTSGPTADDSCIYLIYFVVVLLQTNLPPFLQCQLWQLILPLQTLLLLQSLVFSHVASALGNFGWPTPAMFTKEVIPSTLFVLNVLMPFRPVPTFVDI